MVQRSMFQSDWNETDTNDDAFIQNKPSLFSGSYSDLTDVPVVFIRVDNSDIEYPQDHQVNLNPPGGRQETVGDIYVFQFAHDFTPSDSFLRLSVNGSTSRRTRIQEGDVLRDMTLNDVVRYNYYFFMRAGTFWHFVAGTRVSGTEEQTFKYAENIFQGGTGITLDFNDTDNEITVNRDTLTDSDIPDLSTDKNNFW